MRIIRCALESLQKKGHVLIQTKGIGLSGRNYPKGISAHLYQHLPSTSLAEKNNTMGNADFGCGNEAYW